MNTENATIETAALGEILNRVTARHLIDTYCQDAPLADAIARLLRSNVDVQSEQTGNDQVEIGGWFVSQRELDRVLYGDPNYRHVTIRKTSWAEGQVVDERETDKMLTELGIEELLFAHIRSEDGEDWDMEILDFCSKQRIVSYNSGLKETYWVK